jgi:thiol-disulfide isomerase/thioredoxin
MLKTLAAKFQNFGARQAVFAAIGVAALGITGAVWLSNGAGSGATCAAQPEMAAAIDAVAIGELAALTPTAGGRAYGDMEFVDDTGRPVTLKDYAGPKYLVNFWATWCVPCREEMPALNALAARYDTDDFMVVPINLDLGDDGVLKAQKFLDDAELTNLPLFADPTFSAFDRLKANGVAIGLPATLLLDEEGCEIAVLQGPAEWDAEDAHNVVDALLAAR